MNRLIALFVVAACGGAPAHPAAPTPHRYPVPTPVSQLLVDDASFAPLATALRRDTEAELAGPLPDVKTTTDRRFTLALLDALDDRWADAVAELDKIRAIEPDPRAKVMTGLTIRIWADARSHGGETPASFHAALERMIATLPVALVKDDLTMLRTIGQVFTVEVCRKLVDDHIVPVAGTISPDDAQAIAFQRYAVERLVPVGGEIDAALEAHGIAAKTE
jgi:hypothetical protein